MEALSLFLGSRYCHRGDFGGGHAYMQKKGVIRVLVGMLNRGLLPFSTDLVFGVEGYEVTFTLEANDLEPATIPPESNGQMDQDDPKSSGDGYLDNNNPDQVKKQKNTGGASGSGSAPTATGPSPMQFQFVGTPFGNKRPAPLTKF